MTNFRNDIVFFSIKGWWFVQKPLHSGVELFLCILISSHQCFNNTFITGLPQQVRPARLLSYLDFAEQNVVAVVADAGHVATTVAETNCGGLAYKKSMVVALNPKRPSIKNIKDRKGSKLGQNMPMDRCKIMLRWENGHPFILINKLNFFDFGFGLLKLDRSNCPFSGMFKSSCLDRQKCRFQSGQFLWSIPLN